MVRIAGERISDLFALAEKEASRGETALADRYVALARRIGMRYNVRLLPEYRELYCRGCRRFWLEGRTVRTRLRGGHRVRTCLICGRERRTRLRGVPPPRAGSFVDRPGGVSRDEGALVEEGSLEEGDELPDEESEEA